MTKEVNGDGRDDMLISERVTEQSNGNSITGGFSPEYLKVYYGQLFPHADIFKWMSYGNDGKHPACDHSYFGRREFSFILDNDIYLRFMSFNSVSELENAIKEKCPIKIDIGPVYSVDPAKRHAYAQAGDSVFTPVERELIFDIDMSEYDDVRYCCSGADVCLRLLAANDNCYESDGYCTESGRRGVHCWVCDGRARRLTNEQRAAVADYFRVYKGNENSNKVSLVGPVLHPLLARSYTDVLRVFFEDKMLRRQELFANEQRYQKILDIIPDEAITTKLQGKWQENRLSSISKEDVNVARWEQLKHLLQTGKHKLLEELNNSGADNDNEVDRTSLGRSVTFFRTSFLQSLLKSCKEEMKSSYNAKLQQSKNSLSW